jgi:GNAT superfamily N-acetyltransferase
MEKSNLIGSNFYQHCWKITSQVSGMKVYFTKNLSISDCSLSCDTFNIIYIHSTETLTLEELLQAKRHFEQKNFAYTIWIEEQCLSANVRKILEEASIQITHQEPGMILNLHSYQLIENNSFKNIKKAVTSEQVQEYAQIVAQNWQPPDENLIAYYTAASQAILTPNLQASLYVYYHSGKPVAAIELFVSDKQTAGIFNLSTLVAYRGQGIGTAMITYVLNKAKQQGYSFAVLQASDDGIGIYKKIGFTTETYFYELHG